MQTEEPLKTSKTSSPNQPKEFEPLSNEKVHGKIYLTAQKFKDTCKDRMKNFFGGFKLDQDDSDLVMALMIPE